MATVVLQQTQETNSIWDYIRKLDYSVKDPKKRVKIVRKILGEKLDIKGNDKYACYDDFIVNYYNTESVRKGLEIMATYIIEADRKEKRKKLNKEKKKRKYEQMSSDPEKEAEIMYEKKKKKEIYRINGVMAVEKKDREKFSELWEINKAVELLETSRRKGKNIKGDVIGRHDMRKYNRIIPQLKNDEKILKEFLVGMIEFQRIDRTSTKYCFDEDTGYFDGDNYVKVSENRIEFNKELHIYELIEHYAMLKAKNSFKVNSDMKYILDVLDEIIRRAKLPDYMQDILNWKIRGFGAGQILHELQVKYGLKISEGKLSRIYKGIIPYRIVQTYEDWYEDWLYTYKVKGHWKTCSECGKAKLASQKYFGKDERNLDGLKGYCKKCSSK